MKSEDIQHKIDLVVERGLSDEAIRQMLLELYHAEIIRFDRVGNPYWESCGESIDPEIELDFGG